jgi:hypothetical protein
MDFIGEIRHGLSPFVLEITVAGLQFRWEPGILRLRKNSILRQFAEVL